MSKFKFKVLSKYVLADVVKLPRKTNVAKDPGKGGYFHSDEFKERMDKSAKRLLQQETKKGNPYVGHADRLREGLQALGEKAPESVFKLYDKVEDLIAKKASDHSFSKILFEIKKQRALVRTETKSEKEREQADWEIARLREKGLLQLLQGDKV